MHRSLVAAFATVSVVAVSAIAPAGDTDHRAAGGLDARDVAAGWRVLFDGSSTDAWRAYRGSEFPSGGWSVDADGNLVTSGGGGDIITREQFGDFELVLEWSASKGGNSGIMYRVTESADATYMTGPEYQILDDAGYGEGVPADADYSAGALYAIQAPPADKVLESAGAWNVARVRLKDGIVTHWLNGRRTAEIDLEGEDFAARVAASKFAAWDGFGTAKRGHIALQAHGDPIRFRNVRVRSLDAPVAGSIDLLAGDSLDQWTAFLLDDGRLEDVWSIEDGVMSCAGRPIGYLKTKASYRDYVLQLEWRFDPERGPGNSGVLLRQIGEDTVWPTSVEAQLHSGSAGDFWNIGKYPMTVAADRTNGRNTKRTATNERPLGGWNHYEIIVDGGLVRLVVNGEVLNEATGVAANAGPICLQSEGAFIQFRNVRVTPISRTASGG